MSDSNDSNVAILWDVENVAPNAAAQMVSSIMDFAGRHGRVSVSFAFADWTRKNWKGSDGELAKQSFQLVHIPRGRKNSSDISMVTHAMELLFLYPHISTYILVTGDTDFRPLVVSIRRRGARSIVLCDSKNASEDLLALADSFQDYRDLVLDDSADDGDEGGVENGGEVPVTRDRAFGLLAETVQMMRQQKKTPTLGPAKIRLKLLNESFDEAKLGYRSWKAFVLDARDHGYVSIVPRDNDLVLTLSDSSRNTRFDHNEPFATLRSVVAQMSGKDGRPVPFAAISKAMKERNVDYRAFGYTRFKKLAEAAEKRGIIELKNEGMDWYARLSG